MNLHHWIEILISECDKTTIFAFEYIEQVTWWFDLKMIFNLIITFLHNLNIACFWVRSMIIFSKIILLMLSNKLTLRSSTMWASIWIWTSMRFLLKMTKKWILNVTNFVLNLTLLTSCMKIKNIELIFITRFWNCRNLLLIKIIVQSEFKQTEASYFRLNI